MIPTMATSIPRSTTKSTILPRLLTRTLYYITLTGAITAAIFNSAIALMSSSFRVSDPVDLLRVIAGVALIVIFMSIAGAISGSIFGVIASLICAILTVPLTLLLFHPPTNPKFYAATIRTLATITVTATYWQAERPLAFIWDETSANRNQQPPYLIVPIVAALSAYLLSGSLTRWYLRPFQTQPDTPQLS